MWKFDDVLQMSHLTWQEKEIDICPTFKLGNTRPGISSIRWKAALVKPRMLFI
jgi:hypothetical protein